MNGNQIFNVNFQRVSSVSDMGGWTEPIQAEVCVGLERGM